ncbi:MAG: hypothetical protein KatS3mg060_3580 [Dehalococcoidia bacterium]|nr:MAG: hypothetical protein KatS3mg060_3580 [Dehalococcoidia bacterium]
MHVGVIGAGALGLMAAWQFARAGHRVTVLEREKEVGGLAVNFTLGGTPLERFYHHIFRSDTRMIRLIHELGLGGKLVWGRPPTALRLKEQTHRFDDAFGVLRFPFLSLADRLRLGLVVAYLKVVNDPARFEPYTAAEWLRRMMGARAYETVWAPQLRGKLGDYADHVSMPWFWARVHDRSAALGYVRGGFGQVFERLAEEVRRLGGVVRTGQTVLWIGLDAGQAAVRSGSGVERFDHLVVTLPTALFLRLAPDLPDPLSPALSRGLAAPRGTQCRDRVGKASPLVVLALDPRSELPLSRPRRAYEFSPGLRLRRAARPLPRQLPAAGASPV